MYFTLGNTAAGRPTWWLYAANHELVAWAGETFGSSSNARRAAEWFKAGAQTARYDVFLDTGGQYRWRAWRSSDQLASSGELFSSKFAAQTAADNVRESVGGASMP